MADFVHFDMNEKGLRCSGPERNPRDVHSLSNIGAEPQKRVADQAAHSPSGLRHRFFQGRLEVPRRGLEKQLHRLLRITGEDEVNGQPVIDVERLDVVEADADGVGEERLVGCRGVQEGELHFRRRQCYTAHEV